MKKGNSIPGASWAKCRSPGQAGEKKLVSKKGMNLTKTSLAHPSPPPKHILPPDLEVKVLIIWKPALARHTPSPGKGEARTVVRLGAPSRGCLLSGVASPWIWQPLRSQRSCPMPGSEWKPRSHWLLGDPEQWGLTGSLCPKAQEPGLPTP